MSDYDLANFLLTGNYIDVKGEYVFCQECDMDVRLPHGHLRF